jgi:hypothetical protein
MKIWVLVIDGTDGLSVTAYDAYELAQRRLAKYVAENWNEEIMDMPLPDEIGEAAIEEYFDSTVEDTYYLESATVYTEKTECPTT